MMPFSGLFKKNPVRPETHRLAVTVDVEIDAGPKWKTSQPASFIGVTEGLPRLIQVLDRYDAQCTLFLSPAVLYDDSALQTLRSFESDRVELAAHLHGDYVQPEARYAGPDFSGCDPSDMQCDYAPDIEIAKLKTLTDLFQERFGKRPRSFRAGRFGARTETIACLKELGYTHDSSVTPTKNWYDKADFSRATLFTPYQASAQDLLREGDSGIVEVPVSITEQAQWLRPTPGFSNEKQLQKTMDWFEKKFPENGLCMMFHNVELIPGKSPYCAEENDCQEMLARIDFVLKLAKERGYAFSKVCDIPARRV